MTDLAALTITGWTLAAIAIGLWITQVRSLEDMNDDLRLKLKNAETQRDQYQRRAADLSAENTRLKARSNVIPFRGGA